MPGKNIKLLNEKPLILYTVDAARGVSEDLNICVSTDDLQIAEVVRAYGLSVPFIRPPELSTDSATSEQVLMHALAFYESLGNVYDYIVLLQPTSPLRTASHLKEAMGLINDTTEIIVSVKETDANPYYVLFEEGVDGYLESSKEGKFTRRQDCPTVYELNGAIYIIKVSKFKEVGLSGLKKQKYLMNKASSVDIDDLVDFNLAELLIKDLK